MPTPYALQALSVSVTAAIGITLRAAITKTNCDKYLQKLFTTDTTPIYLSIFHSVTKAKGKAEISAMILVEVEFLIGTVRYKFRRQRNE